MPPQSALPGFGNAEPTDQVFFAILPDDAAGMQASVLSRTLRDTLGLRGRTLDRERLHVTLLPLGNFPGLPRGLVNEARDAAASVAFPSFRLAFDRVGSFSGRPGNLPLVLRVGDGLAALGDFQRSLAIALKRAGLGRHMKSGFVPHMTLLYDASAVAERPVAPVGWTVREFVLIHSLLGQTKHIVLGRWPLREA